MACTSDSPPEAVCEPRYLSSPCLWQARGSVTQRFMMNMFYMTAQGCLWMLLCFKVSCCVVKQVQKCPQADRDVEGTKIEEASVPLLHVSSMSLLPSKPPVLPHAPLKMARRILTNQSGAASGRCATLTDQLNVAITVLTWGHGWPIQSTRHIQHSKI